jgi:quercetin dioxygenase-like cupin family protein
MVEVKSKKLTMKGSEESFTGDAWFDVIAEGVPPSRLRVTIVWLSPGAHTAWHRHANGQTLHVTQGRGLMQARGGEVIEVRPGDTIHTPPEEWHWHGAAPGHFMSHLSISEDLAEGQKGPVTEWGEHLTDEEYRA